MASITREDGQRFIIPSYRDVLSPKKVSLLEKEVRLLSNSYGEYIALQRKNLNQYEVAFSPEPGFLLGETVWSYFKRPKDLLYCEEIPETNEAILVIVKSGSVYLDGNFPIDSIPDELVIFKTQTNHFEIYIHGNVPISKTPAEGKFSFDSSSVASFNVLQDSAFARLPLSLQFELQLVDRALAKQGIGVLPIKKFALGLLAVILVWTAWHYFSSYKEVLPTVIVRATDPYQTYFSQLASPDPSIEIQNVQRTIMLLYSIPGWVPVQVTYGNQNLSASVKSLGVRVNTLSEWAKNNKATVSIRTDGFYLDFTLFALNRAKPVTIYKTEEIIANLIDRLSYILPGNSLVIGQAVNKGKYTTTAVSINFTNIVPSTLGLIGRQLYRLPVILNGVTIQINDQGLSGTIAFTALGN